MAPQKTVAKQPASASFTAVESLWMAYSDNTPKRLKLIDAFLVFLMLSGIAQFLYCILVTNFPFNAFLAGSVPRHSSLKALLTVGLDFRAASDSSSSLRRYGHR